VNADCLKLSVYFGESDRSGRHLLSDVLLDRFERAELQAAILMRAVEGFGVKQHLRTDRLLTLSEDLPLVAVAVDERARIEALLPAVSGLVGGGLVTLERARLLRGAVAPVELPPELHEATKLTIYLGRDERFGNRPAYLEVVDCLRASGLAGATVLLGVDGMTHRRRQRARFFSRNAAVPLLVVSVGSGDAVNAALGRLGGVVSDPIATLERVRLCKRDGVLLAEPRHLPERDDAGLRIWQKLMVYAGEQTRHDGRPLHLELIRRLRAEGAERERALAELRELLLRAARFEVGRRRTQMPQLRGGDHEDIAQQSANDALVAILTKLDDYRGDSRFTTWAYKFALYESAAALRRRSWQGREVPLDSEDWTIIADPGSTPDEDAETAELVGAVGDAIENELTPHQREILVAITLNGVPIDVLAERLGTTRNALYKNLHDARVRLRADLVSRGLLDPPRPREASE